MRARNLHRKSRKGWPGRKSPRQSPKAFSEIAPVSKEASEVSFQSKILPHFFRLGKYCYTQELRFGDVAMYYQCKEDGSADAWEVIKIQKHSEESTIPSGKIVTEGAEFYPKTKDWGKLGWTFTSREKARRKVSELLETENSGGFRELKSQ